MNYIQIFYLLLGLSLLIILHELGHFIPAKLFGTRVKKFYLFFDFLFPFSKVLPFSLFKKKIGDTEYGIGWFPFGGYVDIAGMVDETTSEEELEKDDTPIEQQFRFKPAWQRLIIMVGGVTVNLVLAMFIYTGLFGIYGEQFLPNKNLKNGIMIIDSVAYDLGLQNGDKLVALDGKKIERFDNFQKDMLLNQAKELTIERNGIEQKLPISKEFLGALIQKKKTQIVMPVMPFVIDSIIPNKPASSAGFKKDDILLSVNNTPTPTYADAHHIIAKYANTQIPILVLRNKDTVQLNVTPDATAKIGIQAKFEFENLYPTENIDYNLFAAISRGFKEPFTKISEYWKSLKLMALPKVELKDNLGGFYSMGKIMPSTWDWRAFWSITALISVILALMNILPIPMLDGGYIVFLFYEMIVGKPLPLKVQNVLQSIGLIIILGLMLFANGMDIFRGIFG
jgi:regulator of sigma E protease